MYKNKLSKKDLMKLGTITSDLLNLNTVLKQSLEAKSDMEYGGREHVYMCDVIDKKICQMLDIL